jgi:hypothetical protein
MPNGSLTPPLPRRSRGSASKGEPIRHRIVVSVDVDMVVEADPPDPPSGGDAIVISSRIEIMAGGYRQSLEFVDAFMDPALGLAFSG